MLQSPIALMQMKMAETIVQTMFFNSEGYLNEGIVYGESCMFSAWIAHDGSLNL